MRIPGIVSKFLALVFIAGFLFACNAPTPTIQVPGVTYVGEPGASSIFWSPKDSTKILVNIYLTLTEYSKVYILDTITKKKTMLVDAKGGNIGASAWSPDGKFIALSVEGGMKEFSHGGLWAINTEDNSKESISDKYGTAYWLPDGNTLALRADFASPDQYPRRISIYLMDIQSKKLELIYSNQVALTISDLSSSPDGKFLVFSLALDSTGDTENLYILDIQTGTVSQLTHDGVSASPEWSPRGDLIAYQKWSTIGNEITPALHITPPDGSCDIAVPNVKYAFSPTWSLDGRKIAFIGKDGIYVLDTDIVFGRDIYQKLCP